MKKGINEQKTRKKQLKSEPIKKIITQDSLILVLFLIVTKMNRDLGPSRNIITSI